MKQNMVNLIILMFLMLASGTAWMPIDKIAIGDTLPYEKVKMEDISGRSYSLNKLKKKNGILVVFAANKCVAIKYWGERLMEIARYAEANDIGLVWVNSNQTQRSEGESLEDMKKFAAEMKINFPYVVDKDFLLADTFGTEVTPTSYLFDSNAKLVYQGLVDDNMMDAASVQQNYLKDALTALVSKKNADIKEIFGRGCRIPRE